MGSQRDLQTSRTRRLIAAAQYSTPQHQSPSAIRIEAQSIGNYRSFLPCMYTVYAPLLPPIWPAAALDWLGGAPSIGPPKLELKTQHQIVHHSRNPRSVATVDPCQFVRSVDSPTSFERAFLLFFHSAVHSHRRGSVPDHICASTNQLLSSRNRDAT